MSLLRLLLSRRGLLPGLAVVALVAGSALRASPAATLGSWALAALSVALVLATSSLEGKLAWSTFGAALALASLAGTGADAGAYAWIDAAGLLGGAVCAWSAARSIASTPGSEGLAAVRTSSGRATAPIVALVWVMAAIAVASPSSGLPSWLAVAAPATTLAALIAFATIARFRRALELAAEARLAAAVAVTVIMAAVSAAAFVAGARVASPIARAVLPLGCVAIALVTSRFDPLVVWRVVRRTAVLAAAGGGVALVMAIFAADAPARAPVVVLVAVAAAVALGTQSKALEQLAAPESQALLAAVEDARRRILEAEPEDAITVALSAVRSPHPGASPPELYSLTPARCTWVDAAGYLHHREGELPERLVPLASLEPCGVLRTDVLEPLEVRRPDLRPLLAWMHDARVLAAVVVVRSGQPEGVLLLPRGARTAPLTLEEVTALQSLSTSLGMALSSRAALARSHDRERAAEARAEEESDRAAALAHTLSLLKEQNRRATERLARPAAIGIYSAPSRLAYDAALRRAQAQAPVFVRAPSGVDPVPYLARAHLAGPRANGPFVIVDGTSAREHDLPRWKDPRVSPLALADEGVLVLLDAPALPADVQQLIGQTLSERRPPWERPQPLDVVLAVSSARSPSELAEPGGLDPALALRLGDALDAPIELPRLSERPEDLRAIVSDRLAREGLRLRGTPLGIDSAAFGRLVEYPFLGEDAELASICQRLAAICKGDVVRAEDVEQLGIPAPARESPAPEGPPARGGPRAVRR